ncbi:glycoside hydrolase family 5 protein [Atractiella rhizophila]|nr:glycoside hydrolase family 5 protein [Atractiella rhizophila]
MLQNAFFAFMALQAIAYAASIHTGTSTGWDDPVLKEKLKRAEFHSVYNGSGELGKRTTNECGAQCTTFCYTGDAGTGPNTGDCADIGGMISVGVYGSQFTTKAGQETSIVKNSCKTFFHNQASDGQDAVYCTADLAAVNNYIANNCAAAQNAHGGICVSGDGRFYIETINSYNQGPFASVNLPFASGKIRGVNLGGLFVVEPWMMGGEWARMGCDGTNDEWQCMTERNAQAGFESHWDQWITEQDIIQIANWGLNTVRIPVGYWIVDGARAASDPYATGGFSRLQRLLQWCNTHNVYAIIDLHAAPGVSTPNQQFAGHSVPASQVGFYNEDNFGRAKLFLWNITTHKITDPSFAAVFALEVLNEPWTQNTGSPSNIGLITSYYPTAYQTIRSREQELGRTCSNTGTPYKRSFDKRASYTDCLNILFMDTNWGSGDSATFLPGLSHVMFDDHRYFAYSPDLDTTGEILSAACDTNPVKQGAAPKVFGEFSLATTNQNGDLNTGNTAFYQNYMNRQIQTYEKGIGWTFWSYKTETDYQWSYIKGVQAGVISSNAATMASAGTC